MYNRYMHIFWIQYMIISRITVLIWNSCYLDMLSIEILYVKLSATWKPPLVFAGATSRVPHLLFSFILFSDTSIAHVLLSCYMLHALLLSWFIIIFNKYNMELGETWRLTRSCGSGCHGSIFIPLQGMIVLATDYLQLIELLISCSPLSGGPWSQQLGIRLRPWFWVCTGYTHTLELLDYLVSN